LDPIYHDYTDLLLFASDIFLLATLALWIVDRVLSPRRLKTGPPFLAIPIASITVFAIVSTLSSVDPTISVYQAARLVLLAGLYLYVVNENLTLNSVVLPIAIQLGLQAIVGVVQVMQQHSIGLWFMQELELDPAWSGVSIVWAEGIRSLRAYGLADHPNILGGCLAFGLLVMAAWYAGAETKWHTVVSGLFALGAIGLLLTFSRSAWFAFAGGFLFGAVVLWRTHRQALVRWVGIAVAALIVVSPFVWHNSSYLGVRLNQGDAFNQVATEARSLAERDRLSEAVSQIFTEHPWLGIGVGALPQAEQVRYSDFGAFNAYYQPAHFVLLDVAAETGIFGALFYMVILVAPWLALWVNRKRLVFSPALVGISGVLFAVMLVGFFDYYTWLLSPGRLWQWLVWGLWGAIYSTSITGEHHA
ncbi:MAG TPA: O-antigen ligase family protein, partial [Anaerolineae bacterium]